MRSISKNRAVQLRKYSKLRKDYLETFHKCEVCNGRDSVEIHHKKGRCGDMLLKSLYWLAVCQACHEKIERCRKWAYEKGYLLTR